MYFQVAQSLIKSLSQSMRLYTRICLSPSVRCPSMRGNWFENHTIWHALAPHKHSEQEKIIHLDVYWIKPHGNSSLTDKAVFPLQPPCPEPEWQMTFSMSQILWMYSNFVKCEHAYRVWALQHSGSAFMLHSKLVRSKWQLWHLFVFSSWGT